MLSHIVDFADICFWIYVLIAVISLYGFCLFLWWKRLVGHASEVYNYVMLMFGCIFFTYTLNAYARFVFVNDVNNLNEYEAFITHWVWQLRALPNLIVISLIVFRMNQRARKSIKLSRKAQAERRLLKRRVADK
jgi:hypothetical protein